METILVAGAGGFIGGHLVKFLKDKYGKEEVRAVDKKPISEWYQVHPEVENLCLDVSKEKNCVRATESIKEVYNLACYDKETEVLTKDGFKLFKDLNDNDLMATLNKDNDYLEYQNFINKIEYNYNGQMYNFDGKSFNFMVTPNHNMYIKRPHKNDFEKRRADECDLVQLKFKSDAKWKGENIKEIEIDDKEIRETYHFNTKINNSFPIKPFLKFFGYYLAEGCCVEKKRGNYCIKIANTDKNIIKKVYDSAIEIGLNPLVEENTFYGITIQSIQLFNYLKTFGKAHEKYIPQEIKNLSPELLKILFDAMMEGDGSKRGREYYTVSKKLAGDVQEILLKIGYSSTVSKKVYDNINWHDKYSISFTKNGVSMIVDRPKKVEYNDKVYCVEVPNHLLFVRRNGKSGWCGNCDMGGIGFIENFRVKCMRSVLINTNLIEAAYNAGVKKYFYSSSACAYNTDLQKNTEVMALKETDAYPAMAERGYGWEKLYSEMVCQEYWAERGMETYIARFHNVYGPYGEWENGREKAPAAISRKVIDAVFRNDKEIEIWGDGTQTRSFMWIDDCINGIQKIVNNKDLIATPINLGSSELISINDLVSMVEEIAGVKLNRKYKLDAPKGVAGRNSDNTFIKEMLDWEPNTLLRTGMEKTYEWIERQYRNKYNSR